jgi:hypothetical protein
MLKRASPGSVGDRCALTAVFLVAALVVGCDEQSAPTEGITPSLGEAGNSGCYTVEFTDHIDNASGSSHLTGDLVGSTVTSVDPSEFFAFLTGYVYHQQGIVRTYEITGGLIPELVGQSFTTDLTFKNVFPPDNDPSVTSAIGTEREREGVDKANLTLHGRTSLVTLLSELDYRGVICP